MALFFSPLKIIELHNLLHNRSPSWFRTGDRGEGCRSRSPPWSRSTSWISISRRGEREVEELRNSNHHLMDKLEHLSRSRSSSHHDLDPSSWISISRRGEREVEELRNSNHHLMDKLEHLSRSRSSSPSCRKTSSRAIFELKLKDPQASPSSDPLNWRQKLGLHKKLQKLQKSSRGWWLVQMLLCLCPYEIYINYISMIYAN